MNNPTLFDFAVGVTTLQAKLLCHKDGPDTSRQAAQKMVESGKLNKQELMVKYQISLFLHRTKYSDFTAKELAQFTLSPLCTYHTIQRRLSGLYRKGKITRTGKKRNGCAVWRLT